MLPYFIVINKDLFPLLYFLSNNREGKLFNVYYEKIRKTLPSFKLIRIYLVKKILDKSAW